jgi:zinc transport system substrate-binding protein
MTSAVFRTCFHVLWSSMRLSGLCFSVLCLLIPVFCQAQPAPLVAASIKPLQHIAAAITQGVSDPLLVLDGNQDPHHASLRPSQRQLLQEADILLWIGPSLELPLQRLVNQFSGQAISAEALASVTLVDPGEHPDPHLWLDTGNALAIATALAQELGSLDAANADRYARNLQDFSRSLQQLEAEIRSLLFRNEVSAWAVEHHAFRYLERQFGLPAALQLKDSDNNMPGLRSIRAFTQAMLEKELDCILIESGTNTDALRSLLGDLALRFEFADIMGYDLEPGPASYVRMLQGAATSLSSCIGSAHE